MPRELPENLSYLLEQMQCLGPVEARRMFGAYGIFIDGIMFGLYSDEQLYLKADSVSAEKFEQRGLPPFIYQRSGKEIALSYRCAPEDFIDDTEVMSVWGMEAIFAAHRSRR